MADGLTPKMFVLVFLLVLGLSLSVTIDNTFPKLDLSGNIVDGHDGTYRLLG